MYYIDDKHEERFENALRATGAVKADGKVNVYYGASLYLLTGLAGAWGRLKRYAELGCLDLEEMLENVVLSSGEAIIVRLAGNFYNGGFWEGVTPWDIISELDVECLSLVLCSFSMRASALTIKAISVA